MKKLAIIGSITCVVGVIIFISAFASIGWDITKISTRPKYEERHFSTENTNQTITLKIKTNLFRLDCQTITKFTLSIMKTKKNSIK